jgi:hypothetical protein
MGKPKNSNTRYQQQFGGGGKFKNASSSGSAPDDSAVLAARRQARQQKAEQIDAKFGYENFAFHNSNGNESRESRERRGWLFNMLSTTVSSRWPWRTALEKVWHLYRRVTHTTLSCSFHAPLLF